MKEKLRSHNCGQLREQNVNLIVTLIGWVATIRVTKHLIFIDLRDMYGITQLLVKSDNQYFEVAKTIKVESIIQATGKVVARKTTNEKLLTGKIEIDVHEITIFNNACDLPFAIKDEVTALEDLRLQYRYLDLRRKPMLDSLIFKNKTINLIRQFLTADGFLEIDTPCLTKSTPEGARDFLVPARMQKYHFYALPQSPQIYKQLLMVSGIDKYYQIAKCFRDEDFRSDRQPEFQQLDLEMAFVASAEVIAKIECLLQTIWMGLQLPLLPKKLLQITYHDAISKYGTDKPDLRCTCTITNYEIIVAEQSLFGFAVNDQFDDHTAKVISEIVQQHDGNYFLVYSYEAKEIIFNNSGYQLTPEDCQKIEQQQTEKTKICYLVPGQIKVATKVLGAIRTFYCTDEIKQLMHNDFISRKDTYQLLWVIDWPLFEMNEGKIQACHHPFTNAQNPELILQANTNEELLSLKAEAYDLVLNGYEIAGGSVRISNKKIQKQIFTLLGLDQNVINKQFGFFLTAFDYGIPPHAGIAFGLDRLIMILNHQNSIRDSIAFPKNNRGICLLTQAPSLVDEEQLNNLNLKIISSEK